MLKSPRITVALCATTLVLSLGCANSFAAAITVKVRVEGSTNTLFEGNVTTQPEKFETTSSGGAFPCNYKENGPSSKEKTTFENGGNESATPTTALHAAALAAGLTFNAEWFGSGKTATENPGDFFVTQVGTDLNQSEEPFDSWGYAVNDTTAVVGGCQIALAPGNEVLWAYNYFNLKHLLSIGGPAIVTAGVPFTVHVTDGQNGEPISGAAIGELLSGVTAPIPASATTDINGNTTITLARNGAVTLKATRADSVRSNGLAVNVEEKACACAGPPSSQPPPTTSSTDVAKVGGVHGGHRYTHRSAPRVLSGTVAIPAGGTLRDVRISLTRRRHGRCFAFSGSRGRFVRDHKCRPSFFSVGGSESFSYLLPARLPAGHYTYDIEAIDSSGKPTKLVGGTSHVVFSVG
ncbi:MAG TPA: Ig-like domain-containing protein [Solirubrobacteraceae bacterium]|jgi:hypothetical protein